MMRRMNVQLGIVVAAGFLASVGASAQVTGSFDASVTRSFLEPEQLNRASCSELDGDATLTLRGSGPTGATLRGYVIDDLSGTAERPECLELVRAEDEGRLAFEVDRLTTPASSFTEEIAVPLADLVGDGCASDDGVRSNDTALCVYLTDSRLRQLARLGFFVAIDTHVPPRPTVEGLSAGNGRLSFDVGNVEDTPDVFEFLVQHRPCTAIADGGVAGDGGASALGDAGPSDAELIEADSICDAPVDFTQTVVRSEQVALTGLRNGVQYELRVLVRDDFGNVSEPSEAITATPQKGISPLDFYNGAGSPYSTAPSCSSLQGSALPVFGLFALLGFVGLRRRKRTQRGPRGTSCAALVLPALLASSAGYAQDDDGFKNIDTRNGEVTLSMFVGPYHPGIDDEQVDGGAIFPIYECFFDDATLVELGASLDYHLLDIFGSLQIGLGVNATQAKGFALAPTVTGVDGCGQRTDDSVELTIVKVKPQLSYRLDPLLDWFGFPLVPYGRVGLVGAGYAFTTSGLFPDAPTKAQNPVGLVLGWEAAGGLMLALDFWDYIDPFSKYGTKRARAHEVFDHAFVYGEALWQPVDNFGRPSLILSPTDPFSGTSSPWTVHFGVAVELL